MLYDQYLNSVIYKHSHTSKKWGEKGKMAKKYFATKEKDTVNKHTKRCPT